MRKPKPEISQSVPGGPILLRLDIRAIPKGRPRFWNGRAVTPPKTRKYEQDLIRLAKPHAPKAPFTGPVLLTCVFTFKRPKKPSRSYPSIGDVSNYVKALEDAWNGIMWVDDTQIVTISARKQYGDSDYIEASIVEGE